MADSIFLPSFACRTRNRVKYGKSWAGWRAGVHWVGSKMGSASAAEWPQLSALVRIKGKAEAVEIGTSERAFRLHALPCSSCAVGRIISRLSGSLELPTKFQKIHETASSSSLLQIALNFRAISLPFQVPFPSVSLYANRVGVKKCRVDEVGAAVGVAA